MYYEMLVGRPGFDSKIVRDEKIREAVTGYRGQLPLERPELVVQKAVDQAIALSGRYNHVLDFGKELVDKYGQPPREKRPIPIRLYVLLGLLAVVFLALLIIAGVLLVGIINQTQNSTGALAPALAGADARAGDAAWPQLN
jgi:hypothetical protein